MVHSYQSSELCLQGADLSLDSRLLPLPGH